MKGKSISGVTDLNPNKYGGMVSRSVALPQERKEIDFSKGIETIATTEAPAVVVDWERWEIVREILPMKYMEAPNGDKVPFLDSHNRSSLDKVKGSARNFRVEGKNLMARVFISDTEKDLQDKIREGHIDSVSIGYRTDSEETIEVPKGKTIVVDGEAYRNDFEDGLPMLVRTWWKTHELSGVAIGADEAAKFKSESADQQALIKKIGELQKEVATLKNTLPVTSEGRRSLTYIEARLKILQHTF